MDRDPKSYLISALTDIAAERSSIHMSEDELFELLVTIRDRAERGMRERREAKAAIERAEVEALRRKLAEREA